MEYDVIIVGAGPAGLSAGLYAARSKLNTLLFEKTVIGGQINTTLEIENYPGSENNITGPELVDKMKEQCLSFGAKVAMENVIKIEKKDNLFNITTNKNTYSSKSCILATGSHSKELGIQGEEEFKGMGVSYCATCDGFFYTNKEVVVIGGGDTALKEAIYLTKFAKKVSVIHRRDEFRANRSLVDRAKSNAKIEFILSSEVLKINGKDTVKSVTIKDKKEDKIYDLAIDGVFMFVGFIPNSKEFEDLVSLDENGYVNTNSYLESETKGLFVAGDVRHKTLRQVITAASDGAICAFQAEEYINENFKEN